MSTELSRLTTLHLGGPARRLAVARTQDELAALVRDADTSQERLLLIGGGSNIVVADAGFAGTAVRILTQGIAEKGGRLVVQAGQPWDSVVEHAIAHQLSGIECLSGIPGTTGATPIQNVGAYGQEVASVIESVLVLDRPTGELRRMSPSECGFGYRTSAFKRCPGRWVVLEVAFELSVSTSSQPIRYEELARTLGVGVGDVAPLGETREAVLALRRSKGMVLDAADPDTRSAGSFFTNPVVPAAHLAAIESAAGETAPTWPVDDGLVKVSAAWLIGRAGFARGQGDPDGIAISSKHLLALTNRGSGTTRQLNELAHAIEVAVATKFSVTLEREPTMVA